MKRMQFSIVSLLGAVTLAGLGCAALVNASPLWAAAIVSLTVLALLAATLAAVYVPSRARAFWGGFALFGWAYLLLTTSALFELEQYLFTGAANDLLYATLNESSPNGAVGPYAPVLVTSAAGPAVTWQPTITAQPILPSPAQPPLTFNYAYAAAPTSSIDYTTFDRIGHSLWAIVLGLAGGVLATYFASKRRDVENPVV